MAGEQLDLVDQTLEQQMADQDIQQNSDTDGSDDGFAAGFDSGGAGEAAPKPEGQSGGEVAPKEAETVGDDKGQGVAAEAAKPDAPEVMQVTRAQWEELTGKAAGVDELRRQMSSVTGRMGDFAKRLDGNGQMVEVTEDDFPELKAEFPELVKAQVAGVNNALKKARLSGGGVSEDVLNREVQAATAVVRRQAIDVQLDNIVDGNWVEEIRKPEFKAWRDGNADMAALCQSDDPRDAATALRGWVKHKTATKPVAPAPAVKTSTRSQQLAAATTPRGTAGQPPARPGEDDDFAAGFKTGTA